MQTLERLALTLGVPVDTFFERETDADASCDALVEDIAALNRAFAAIRDPDMRRYCLDVVRAAGAEVPAELARPIVASA